MNSTFYKSVLSGGIRVSVSKKKKIFIIILTVIMCIVWGIWSNVTIGITHYTITNNKIPSSFNHYKIVVLSDLHNAQFGKNNYQIISSVERECPDMIAITGDLVDSNQTDFHVAIELVEKLTTIAPCFYVTGNHEARLDKQFLQLEHKLLENDVAILHDTAINLKKNNDIIHIAGLDDPDFTDRDSFIHQSILETKLDQMNLSQDYCILLSHRPERFQAYVNKDIDLVLSGHAHGGQFRLPFIGGIIAPNQGFFPKYDSGIFSQKNTTMIVSRGIGNSIIPIRINNRPEIVSIELHCHE